MRVGVQEAGLEELRKVRIEQRGNNLLEPLPSFLCSGVDGIHLNARSPPQKKNTTIYMQMQIIQSIFQEYYIKNSKKTSSTEKSSLGPMIKHYKKTE